MQFTSNEGMSNDAPIHECESETDHYTTTCPTLYEECVGSLTSYRFITCARACETGPTVYRPYPRKSNRLQMLLQRQHFLLSYLKTRSVGPAGV